MTLDPHVVDGLPDPIFFVDPEGRVAYLNRACESAFGRRADEVIGRPLTGLAGTEFDEGLLALLSPPPQTVRPASLPAVRIGSEFWDVRVTPGSNGLTAVYCIPSSGYQASWPELVADSADAIWAVDESERIIAWNRGAEELFGYSSDEIIGQPITRLIPDDLIREREPERLRKALRELGAVRDYQTRRLAKDGREIEVSLTRTVPRNGHVEQLASSTIVRDLSQRRQIERQMIESEKLVTLGQLAASVAQEIGAPLTNIGLVVESLRKLSSGNREAERQLDTVTQQLDRIARLTRGLVELAKPGELKLATLQVGELLDRVLELVQPSLRRAGIAVEVENEPGLPAIRGDPGQLQQVFLNLMMNAQRALEEAGGGRVRLAAERARGFPVEGHPVREVVKIEVSDDGPGIDPADLHYIFAPFFSRSSGSGLGLALAKQIVHAHGGTIDARSTPGRGATFTILLPAEFDA